MIEIILGSMKSGKSGALLDRLDRATYAKRGQKRPKACLVRPATDTREFVTRKGLEKKYDLFVFEGRLTHHTEELRDYDVICIDEGQFFPDLGFALFYFSAFKGKTVHVSCLQGDRNMLPWDAVSKAIPVADKITQVQAVCEFCGDDKKSTFTFYDGPSSSEQVVIGDGEYHAACAECWVEQSKKKEGCISLGPLESD